MEFNIDPESNGHARTSDSAALSSFTITKKTINRPSWKTEFKKLNKLNRKLTIQRNVAAMFAAAYVLIDIIRNLFS